MAKQSFAMDRHIEALDRVAALERALRRALKIIDSPNYRDSAGMRPNADPSVDDMRELLASSVNRSNKR